MSRKWAIVTFVLCAMVFAVIVTLRNLWVLLFVDSPDYRAMAMWLIVSNLALVLTYIAIFWSIAQDKKAERK